MYILFTEIFSTSRQVCCFCNIWGFEPSEMFLTQQFKLYIFNPKLPSISYIEDMNI